MSGQINDTTYDSPICQRSDSAEDMTEQRTETGFPESKVQRANEHMKEDLTPGGYARTTDTSKADGRPVQIFRPERNGASYSVDENQLEFVFGQESVANLPVAIYSITGLFRKGKSFMLSFFFRFLKNMISDKSDSWLQNKSEELSGGFEWKGGRSAHTQGIWIWSEPFFIKTAAHGKVAVFLMDTQGTFDYKTSVQGCSVIFALSTFISSVQIFNIMQHIQENYLQQLQLFTEYGKQVPQKKKKKEFQQEKTFQDLLFLVRDWPDPEVEFGFKGGSEVLSNVLQVQQSHKNLESVRENIAECFESVKCFLMPHPGQKITFRGAKASPPLLQDVDEMFLVWIDVLVRELFSPDKLTVKKINGKVITGNELKIFTLEYCKMFESGKTPEIGTILEVNAKADIGLKVEEAKNRYLKFMKEKSSEVYDELNLLPKFHEQFKPDTLKWYDDQPKLGDEMLIQTYRKDLAEQIDQYFGLFEKAILEQMKNEIPDHVTDVVEKLEKDFERLSNGKYMAKEALDAMFQKSRFDANKRFEEKMRFFNQTSVLKYKEQLNKRVEKVVKRFTEINRHRQTTLIQNLEKESKQDMKIYSTIMNKVCKDKCLEDGEFELLHNAVETSALDKFDASDIGRGTVERDQQRKKLQEEIKHEEQRIRKTNENNKKLTATKVRETLNEARANYKTKMEKVCDDGYIDPHDLERAHDDAKREAKEVIASTEKENGKTFADKYKSQLNEFVDEKYKKLQAKNEDFKRQLRLELEERKWNALTLYKTSMDQQTGKYLEEKEIERIHVKSQSMALENYGEKQQEPKQDFDELKQQLKHDIGHHYQLVRSQNDTKMEQMKNEILNHVTDAVNKFSDFLENLSNGEYAGKESLNGIIRESRTDAIKCFEEKTRKFRKEIVSEQKGKLVEHMEQTRKRFVETNRHRQATLILSLENESKQAIKIYSTAMDKVCDDGYIDPHDLERAHDDAKREAEEVIASTEQGNGKTFADKYKSQLNEFVDEKYKKLQAKNEDFKRQLRLELEERKRNALTLYKTSMDQQTGKYLEEEEIERIHVKSQSMALENYGEKQQEPKKDFDEFKQQLKHDIDHHYQLVRSQNDTKMICKDNRSKDPDHAKFQEKIETSARGSFDTSDIERGTAEHKEQQRKQLAENTAQESSV